ncbi:helix-turn-helix transcriptional regulator [Chelatococcus sp. SYSU_G07232]|uniref:Helix-turn-helix transcriptional regulator n=1 Tax=Chelatococcus albus TaxID=3047466 RepID=A0ABT7AKI5_9HYPH|nr:helix-turn-helix transcriptional regulator [Chelatococcus sp. SYSU_G07232]MDJ1159886.1 helix-turn-helix transcriptional regulator [Chelatococcus sp. SYSU_G07232]
MQEALNEPVRLNGRDHMLCSARLRFDGTEEGACLTGAQPLLSEAAMIARNSAELFGRAVLDLLACDHCFVAVMARAAGFVIDIVEVGPASDSPAAVEAMAQLASREEWHDAAIRPVGPADALATAVLGRAPATPVHALAGSLPVNDGIGLVFLAGWCPAPFPAAELGCISRAVRAIWATIQHAPLARGSSSRLGAFLEALIFPAFIVDEGLRLLEMNEAGRSLLLKDGPLQLRGGFLAGANCSVTRHLQQALSEAVVPRSERTPPTVVVPLSTDRGAFAFAWIGPAWMEDEADRFLLVIPQVDPAAGARRIAAAFGLKWAEERIVACVLCGQPPSQAGSILGLTEATVRTYTKRIMLKLGINRQVEFFLLYILTLSPFRSGQRDQARAHDGSLSAAGGETDDRTHDGAV